MTIEEIKNEVAVENGFKDWMQFLNLTVDKYFQNELINEAMQRYADHVVVEERNNLTNWFNLYQEVMDFVIAELGDEFVKLELPEGNLESGKFLIKALAELKCKEQREICAELVSKGTGNDLLSGHLKTGILNADLATSKTT